MKKVLLTAVLAAFTLGCFSCATKPAGSQEKDKKRGTQRPNASIEKILN